MTVKIFRFALARLRDVGAYLTTSECIILGLAADSAHPKFKGLQKLVMKSAPDTGLLNFNPLNVCIASFVIKFFGSTAVHGKNIAGNEIFQKSMNSKGC